MKFSGRGFSLMELMIVMSLVAILLSLSVPSYKNFIRKSKRAEAIVTLLEWANRQDAWRADNPNYNLNVNPATNQLYAYSMVATAVSYTLTATAQGGQSIDKEGGISCAVMTINQAGITGPSGYKTCWSR